MRRFAALFGEVLLYQHQRIITMTKGYIASNNLPVEIIRFHTIYDDLVTFETRLLEIGSSAVRAPPVAAAAKMRFDAKIAVISTGLSSHKTSIKTFIYVIYIIREESPIFAPQRLRF